MYEHNYSRYRSSSRSSRRYIEPEERITTTPDYYSLQNHNNGVMVFREFDEDDLDSYLEGSVWSETPAAEHIHSEQAVITVFPTTSHTQMAYGYPDNSCETVFTSRRITPKCDQYSTFPKSYPVRHSPVERCASARPGSPGPVVGSGDVTNTEHGFTIELDVFRFRPEEIKIVLTDDLLSISGERFEYCGDGQTLRRSFSRKYSIPHDISLDSIRSHLRDNGILIVQGSRRGWKETNLFQYRCPSTV